MKVERVHLHDDGIHATVVLRPSWLARLLGAPDRVVELLKDPEGTGDHVWKSKVTHTWLGWMKHGTIIKEALEAQPTPGLPRLRLIQGGKSAKRDAS